MSQNSGREAVLGRIRAALQGPDEAGRRKTVAERLAAGVPHLVPARVAGKDRATLRAILRQYLEGQSATVMDVRTPDEVPSTIAGYLRGANLPLRLRMGSAPYLAAMPWSAEPALTLEHGPAHPNDEVGLVHAAAAAAETGTLLIASGSENPVTLNFLPETSIIVVRADDIVESYEAAWERLRAARENADLPRTVNFVSGPSRTGDIGGRIVMGAHGPRRLVVVIVGP